MIMREYTNWIGQNHNFHGCLSWRVQANQGSGNFLVLFLHNSFNIRQLIMRSFYQSQTHECICHFTIL